VQAFQVVSRGGLPAPGPWAAERDLEEAEVILVPVPRDVSSVRDRDPVLAREWRLATRRAYQLLASTGAVLVDNVPGGDQYTLNVAWRAPLNRVLAGPEPWRDCG